MTAHAAQYPPAGLEPTLPRPTPHGRSLVGRGRPIARARAVLLAPGALVWVSSILYGCAEQPRTYDTLGRATKVVLQDNFDGPKLDPQRWRVTGSGVDIRDGRLTLEGVRNHPVWSTLPLPENVDIEFDAWPQTEDGDIKVELAGDGVSFATTASYTATGYVVIFGGWKNRVSIIARQNEHGRDRVSRTKPKAEQGRKYHFQILRRGGTLHWKVDGRDMLTMVDREPLRGPGHEYFAFNNWQAQTQFDNLVIRTFDVAEH